MRSTPMPPETLRTVNIWREPPPLREMTMPWKIWMRSLSPSLTFTWTLTVSPGAKLGMSVRVSRDSTSFMISGMAVPSTKFVRIAQTGVWCIAFRPRKFRTQNANAELRNQRSFLHSAFAFCVLSFRRPKPTQNLPPLLIQLRLLQQIRPFRHRRPKRLFLPPLPNPLMVPRQKNLRHPHPPQLLGARVVRVVEQPAEKRVLLDRAAVADHALDHPAGRVGDQHRRQLAAGDDEVADRDLVRLQ